MTKIDCYPHILPAPLVEKMGDLPLPNLRNEPLHDLDARQRVMDEFPDYLQVLVPFPTQPLVPFLSSPAEAADAIAAGNDHLAELVVNHPDRFVGFAGSVPLFDPDRAVTELVRCVDELGALGIQLETNAAGVPIDDARFEPLFAELARRGATAWLHPVRGPSLPDFAAEDRSRFGLHQALGWPYETSLIMTRLVLGGLFMRHPELAIIIHHGGAMIPHFCNRLGEVIEHLAHLGMDTELHDAVVALDAPIDEHLRRFYADTVLFGAAHAVQCTLDYFGLDHVLFGTDMPFDPLQGPGFIRSTIANIEGLGLAGPARAQLFAGNAQRLFGLPA